MLGAVRACALAVAVAVGAGAACAPIEVLPPGGDVVVAQEHPAVVPAPRAAGIPFGVRTSRRPGGADLKSAREIPGVIAAGRAVVGTADLRAVRGAARALPRAAGRLDVSVIGVDPAPLAHSKRLAGLARSLGEGRAALTETAADVRGMELGDRLVLAGRRRSVELEVGAILAENDLFDHEIVLPLDRARRLGLERTRALVVAIRPGSVPAATGALERALGPARLVRLDVPGKGSGLLSAAKVKEIFGEFAYREGTGGAIAPDPAWVARSIVDWRVPVLGTVRCHRAIVTQLAWAMYEIQTAGLADLIESYDGCYVPRMQRGDLTTLSRHAFGIAVDVNAATNALGAAPSLDRRIVEIMEKWGFVWGGRWLVPDGMHFEFVRFVRPRR